MAQVLSYTGYLQGPDPEQLESQILGKPVLAARPCAEQPVLVRAPGTPCLIAGVRVLT